MLLADEMRPIPQYVASRFHIRGYSPRLPNVIWCCAANAFNEGYMAVMQGKQTMQTAMGESARKWNFIMKDK
jgi:hypothetical protein